MKHDSLCKMRRIKKSIKYKNECVHAFNRQNHLKYKTSLINEYRVVCLLFCVLETSKVISERVLTCNSVHSWWLYSAAPLGNHAITMT